MSETHSVPCHLVNGPLGVGKTTAIIDYLKRHAGGQFVAVLVNDFGPVGLDSAIMQGELQPEAGQRTRFMMVPGGCICCSAAAGLIGAMQELSQLPRLDRIIVEPSGLSLVGDMLDLLESIRQQFHLELRPVITIIDPRDLDRPGFTRSPYHVRMVEAADILVANRCDLSGEEKVRQFQQWAVGLYPPKLRVIATHHGQLPDEVFQLRLPAGGGHDVHARAEQIARPTPDGPHHADHDHGEHAHNHGQAHRHHDHTANDGAGGILWDAGVKFSFVKMEQALKTLAASGFGGVPVARLKAILNTDQGWSLMEIARGEVFTRSTDYRRDNRMDWITQEQKVAPATLRAFLADMIL